MTAATVPITRIEIEMPPIGGKCWVLRETGIFVLEEGPGTFRTCACTHAGSGSLRIFDGLPDDDGFVPEQNDDDINAPGRDLLWHPSTVMGSWMLDGGFLHGLTVVVPGGHEGMAPVASLVWMPRGKAKA